MKKLMMVVTLGLAFVVAGCANKADNMDDGMMKKESTMMKKDHSMDDTMMKKESAMMKKDHTMDDGMMKDDAAMMKKKKMDSM
ncbi:MAG: hypothetical protein COA66_02960 [Arcobacter sp.]|nr:MAG: hypothetical protein COA66_02960 [Arcobacter sp.]